MLLESLRIVPYRLALEPPFRWRAGEIGEREGVLMRVENDAGRVGWGDAAPLPGFSRESAAEEHYEALASYYPNFPALKNYLHQISLMGMINLRA